MVKINKSINDKRTYEHIRLSNNLDVLLISDEETDKSAVAMDVGVGYFSDPDNTPGLAHFLEHMLFMGTKKYPNENYYSEFLAKGGGGSNAYTTRENTNYYFDILNNYFEEAIDIFGQFFISPLFLKDSVEREMNAVHQEHGKNLQSDNWRINRATNLLSNKNHPLYKFGTGNLDTLKKKSIRDILINFYDKYYSANIMKLVILSNLPIKELKKIATKTFSKIKNKNISRPQFKNNIIKNNKIKNNIKFNKLVRIVPIKKVNSIKFKWKIPPTDNYYKIKPVTYISHLLGHEGNGGLYYILKEYGWVIQLYSGESDSMSSNSFIELYLILTDEGMKHILDIYNIVYKYINLIKNEGILEWVYEECKKISELNFKFKSKENPINYVSYLASSMFNFKIENILDGEYIYKKFDKKTIEMFLEQMVPKNCLIILVSKNYENSVELEEKYYKVKYSISEDNINIENSIDTIKPKRKLNLKLNLPTRNVYISKNLKLLNNDNKRKFPKRVKIKNSKNNNYDNIELWYLQDSIFKKPKAIITAQIIVPWLMKSAKNIVKLQVYLSLVMDEMNSEGYAMELAGMKYYCTAIDDYLILRVSGYNDKLDLVWDYLINTIQNYYKKIKKDRFKIICKEYEKKLENFWLESPLIHAGYYIRYNSFKNYYGPKECLKELKKLKLSDMNDIFDKVFMEDSRVKCLAMGNIDIKQVTKMAKRLNELRTDCEIDEVQKKSIGRKRILDDYYGGVEYKNNVFNPNEKNSSVVCLFRTGYINSKCVKDCHKLVCIHYLLLDILQEPFFDILRTKEELGYIVSSRLNIEGFDELPCYGISFQILSSEWNPEHLEKRILNFIENFYEELKCFTDETFNQYIDSAIKETLEKDNKLSQPFYRYWNEIIKNEYNFDINNILVKSFKKIKKKDVTDFYYKYLLYNPKYKTTSFIYGNNYMQKID